MLKNISERKQKAINKYIKKKTEIEAIQFTRKNLNKIIEILGDNFQYSIEKRLDGIMFEKIKTLEGTMQINENDYIVKGIKRYI